MEEDSKEKSEDEMEGLQIIKLEEVGRWRARLSEAAYRGETQIVRNIVQA